MQKSYIKHSKVLSIKKQQTPNILIKNQQQAQIIDTYIVCHCLIQRFKEELKKHVYKKTVFS